MADAVVVNFNLTTLFLGQIVHSSEHRFLNLVRLNALELKNRTAGENSVVNIKVRVLCGGSYEGDFKPSSEFLVHSAVYKARKDAEFVIHTHQTYATVVGALGKKRLKAEKKNQDVA